LFFNGALIGLLAEAIFPRSILCFNNRFHDRLAYEKASRCDGGRRSLPAPERYRLKTGFRRKLCHFKAGFRIGRINNDMIPGG